MIGISLVAIMLATAEETSLTILTLISSGFTTTTLGTLSFLDSSKEGTTLSMTLFMIWVTGGGAWSIKVTATIPVAIEVTKLTSKTNNTTWVLVKLSMFN